MNKSLLFRGRSVIWYSIYLWMFLLGLSCFAQNQQSTNKGPSTALGMTEPILITGTVSDANGVLPGVTVSVKRALRQAQGDKSFSSSNSVITDEKGQFSIAAAEGDTLVFTYVGYKTVAVAVSVAHKLAV